MQTELTQISCTAFVGGKSITKGTLQHIVAFVKDSLDDKEFAQLLIFNDLTGKPIDIDFRGKTAEVLQRLSNHADHASAEEESKQPTRRVGRPKLGVVSGEVTLLPRHWDWLKSQPGGASVTLRKLVDEARRTGKNESKARAAQEASYHFMTAMAGDFPQHEEALRALYAGNQDRFYQLIDDWAPDIRDHIKTLAENAFIKEET
ncbi:hypothetical protein AWU65_24205 [Paenibacillus glucanolyticus]|uniref:DUF2239 domain-containing protein n=1 Tax=Paenibacillus glucanolyticus TaxID=59843 RepID=A0A163M7L2_9BACL|nr:DUF2239 family protein [Paenibacillus glucanolyticus]KZS48816.1 hypothetical protein AWU65_24205 [Paenibacillus glucanolyticus]